MIRNSKRSIRLLSWRTLRWAIAIPTLPLVWWACTSHPLAQPKPEPEQQTDIYISVSPQRQLDLVFMIDNSPSMAPKQAKMNAQFPKLIAALKDPTDGTLPDLRVAIIDSDLGTGNKYNSGSCGPKTLPDGTPSPYGDMGRFQMIGADKCGVNANATYLEYTKNKPVNFTPPNGGDINTVFQCLASGLGTLGCGEEHQLQAFEFALVPGIGLGKVNDDQNLMLRGNAYLGLVFLTDEDDCSAAGNDGMFGDDPDGKKDLVNESASLRCYSRSHQCNGTPLTTSPPGPGYPTTQAFSALFKDCEARTDSCSSTDPTADDSQPTPQCSPLKDIHDLANEIKSLKTDPANQILVAGIFGYPLSDAALATAPYKIDKIPNPNVADVNHPNVYDSWPVCYDPNFPQPKDGSFDPTAAGNGATAGLRNLAFIKEFDPNGLAFSICQTDFSASMQKIGETIAKHLQNLCVPYKLWVSPTTGLPDCRVAYRYLDDANASVATYTEDPVGLKPCNPGDTIDTIQTDCWQLLTGQTDKCPTAYNGQLINVLRTRAEINAGALPVGTKVGMQCRTCTDFLDQNGNPLQGC